VLGDSAADLQQQLVVGILTHGSLQELHDTPMWLEFLNQEDLVDVFAREPIWRSHHDPVKVSQRRPITQLVEPWSSPGRFRVAPL
jgi:hypothetical protein